MIQAFFLQNKDIKKVFDADNKELQLIDQCLIANTVDYQLMSPKLNTFYLGLQNSN